MQEYEQWRLCGKETLNWCAKWVWICENWDGTKRSEAVENKDMNFTEILTQIPWIFIECCVKLEPLTSNPDKISVLVCACLCVYDFEAEDWLRHGAQVSMKRFIKQIKRKMLVSGVLKVVRHISSTSAHGRHRRHHRRWRHLRHIYHGDFFSPLMHIQIHSTKHTGAMHSVAKSRKKVNKHKTRIKKCRDLVGFNMLINVLLSMESIYFRFWAENVCRANGRKWTATEKCMNKCACLLICALCYTRSTV